MFFLLDGDAQGGIKQMRADVNIVWQREKKTRATIFADDQQTLCASLPRDYHLNSRITAAETQPIELLSLSLSLGIRHDGESGRLHVAPADD